MIFCGCSTRVAVIRADEAGLYLINSAAATMSERLLFTSWRKVDNRLLSSSTCSGVNVTETAGVAMAGMVGRNQAVCKRVWRRSGGLEFPFDTRQSGWQGSASF